MASLGGLQYSSRDAVIVMDADLQDPPELIFEMVQKWREGFDVVHAQRRTRDGETAIKRFVSWAGYKLINRIAEVNIPPNTGDFRLMTNLLGSINQVPRFRKPNKALESGPNLKQFQTTSNGRHAL